MRKHDIKLSKWLSQNQKVNCSLVAYRTIFCCKNWPWAMCISKVLELGGGGQIISNYRPASTAQWKSVKQTGVLASAQRYNTFLACARSWVWSLSPGTIPYTEAHMNGFILLQLSALCKLLTQYWENKAILVRHYYPWLYNNYIWDKQLL